MANVKTYANFFALLKQLPHVEKEDIVGIFTNQRTTSLREMKTVEYGKMISTLRKQVDEFTAVKQKEGDQARKRLMAAIGKFLRTNGKPENVAYIKATALNACGGQYDDFNKIPQDRLSSLYNAFKNRNKDAKRVVNINLDKPLNELECLLYEAVSEENYELAQKIKEQIDLLTATPCKK